MAKPTSTSSLTREAVLAELAELAEGRHPSCQSVPARFLRSEEWKQASRILWEAIQQQRFRRVDSELPAPPAWLLPI
jgi:hypothetical protein